MEKVQPYSEEAAKEGEKIRWRYQLEPDYSYVAFSAA